MQISALEIVEAKCYCLLKKIKTIIEDDSLEDAECFKKIEEVMHLFEEFGGADGSRHDFG